METVADASRQPVLPGSPPGGRFFGKAAQQQLPPVKTSLLSTPATLSSVDSSPDTSFESTLSEGERVAKEYQDDDQVLPASRFVFPVPSPRRPRLDPQYAKRCFSEPRVIPPSTPPSTTSTTSPRQEEEEEDFDDHGETERDLMPPPGITRHSFFRPTPILTADPPMAWNSHHNKDDFQHHHQQQEEESDMRDSRMMDRSKRAKQRRLQNMGLSDRFIPNRGTTAYQGASLWPGRSLPNSRPQTGNAQQQQQSPEEEAQAARRALQVPTTTATGSQQTLLNSLLQSEWLGENQPPRPPSAAANHAAVATAAPLQPVSFNASRLRYTSPRQQFQESVYLAQNDDDTDPTLAAVQAFSLTPVRASRNLPTPPKQKRRIPKVPFKVLDAPALQDDFYLNLVDWSLQNVLAVGLGSCVYLWSACTSKVTKLCDLASQEDQVTSVSWAQRGTHLAVGTNRGETQLWDTVKCQKVRSLGGHSARVGTLAWTGPILASGSRDRTIYLRDVRVQAPYTDKLAHHKQEVCGLKWSFDEPALLASGGNDNHLHVMDSRNPVSPLHKFADHTAAVKAIAWSPHQHGLLASGGGTADRCIRFWNTLSGAALSKMDTGSQVCNLAWSQNCNELVSTHGYSLNQIVVWRYPSMQKVTTLTGHTYRVLYLAMSPDGSTVVTGAGDETLRFWQVFPGPRSDGKDAAGGLLYPNTLPGSVIR